jgi:hypothetical protein
MEITLAEKKISPPSVVLEDSNLPPIVFQERHALQK